MKPRCSNGLGGSATAPDGLERIANNNASRDSVAQFQNVWIASGAAALALLGA